MKSLKFLMALTGCLLWAGSPVSCRVDADCQGQLHATVCNPNTRFCEVPNGAISVSPVLVTPFFWDGSYNVYAHPYAHPYAHVAGPVGVGRVGGPAGVGHIGGPVGVGRVGVRR